MPIKRDNGALQPKIRLRQQVASSLGESTRVLEGYTGVGALHRAVWSRFVGATMDKDETKVVEAARCRPHWRVYSGDTVQALTGGWMSTTAWDVVDFDPHGSPWPAFEAWIESPRLFADTTHVFLTDGYMRKASMGMGCKSLFGGRTDRRNIPPEVYRVAVTERMRVWTRAAGLRIESFRSVRSKLMQHHHIVLRVGHAHP